MRDLLERVWMWLRDKENRGAVTVIVLVVGLAVSGAWKAYVYFSEPERIYNDGGGQGGTIGGVTFDANKVVDQLVESHRRELASLKQLSGHEQRAQQQQEQIDVLTEAVNALVKQKEQSDTPAAIEAALARLTQGKTAEAEAIFQEVLDRKAAEGSVAHTEAAAAARHLGALAFLHDTRKALGAYRRAVELDPGNADGWNQLGRLLYRTGDLNDAEAMYRKALGLNEELGSKEGVAIAHRNLGNVYSTRGDLDQAEAMYRKALGLSEELGRKEGMAANYGNLGNVY